MIKNYFKIALRNLLKFKFYSFINVAGLAIGITASILIFLFITDELSYDKFHPDSDRIYRVVQEQRFEGLIQQVAVVAPPIIPALKQDYPEVDYGIRTYKQTALLSNNEKMFSDQDIIYADKDFFNLFGFKLLQGSSRNVLDNENSIVLTKSLSEKIFGSENPVGKNIVLNNKGNCLVTGVIEDPPGNSHITPFDAVISFSTIYDDTEEPSWGFNWTWSYIKLAKGSIPEEFDKKLISFTEKYRGKEALQNITYYLQPVNDIHLHSNMVAEMNANGDILYVQIFSAIGLFILLIACINYMNLATARSSKRITEVGMRKVLGAYKTQLVRQFIAESFFISFIALLIGIFLVELFLPYFNNFTGKNLEINYLNNLYVTSGLLVLFVLVGFVTGAYPAFFLSRFKPAVVLKKEIKSGKSAIFLRRILVTSQFSLSIILIVGTITIFNQLSFIEAKHLGFDKEHLLNIKISNRSLEGKSELFKNQFEKIPGVKSATAVSGLLGKNYGQSDLHLEGMSEDQQWLMSYLFVDPNYIRTTDMELVKGRFFSDELSTDSTEGFVVNESAAKIIAQSPEGAIGKRLIFFDRKGPVIGVIKDFHFTSLHYEIEPLILAYDPSELLSFIVRVSPKNISETLKSIEEVYKQFSPGWPFKYSFVDEEIDALYKTDQKIGAAVGIFALLAITIACLGLLGLTAYTVEQKTKEIGIRKVLGATVPNIVKMLSKEFIMLVVLANIIAWPTAWYFLNKWLEDFAFRTDLSIAVFILSGILTLIIAWLSISFIAVKAALNNPVKSLRYE